MWRQTARRVVEWLSLRERSIVQTRAPFFLRRKNETRQISMPARASATAIIIASLRSTPVKRDSPAAATVVRRRRCNAIAETASWHPGLLWNSRLIQDATRVREDSGNFVRRMMPPKAVRTRNPNLSVAPIAADDDAFLVPEPVIQDLLHLLLRIRRVQKGGGDDISQHPGIPPRIEERAAYLFQGRRVQDAALVLHHGRRCGWNLNVRGKGDTSRKSQSQNRAASSQTEHRSKACPTSNCRASN